MAGGNPAVLQHVIPDTFTGYDLFTDHVHHGTPRLPATENAPDECVICYDTTDEHLFVNPRVACRCSVAAHASCWDGVKDTRCPLCRTWLPRRGGRAGAHVRVPVAVVVCAARAAMVALFAAMVYLLVFLYCSAAGIDDALPLQHAARVVRDTPLYRCIDALTPAAWVRACAAVVTDARRACENAHACVCDVVRRVRPMCRAHTHECRVCAPDGE